MKRNSKKNKIIRACTVPQSLGFLRGIITELKREGYEVVAVSSSNEAGFQKNTYSEESELEKFGKSEGIRTIPVAMERHISPAKDLKSLWSMVKVFCHEKPCMVHSMTPKAGLICMLAAWLTRVPVRVHTFTGLVWPTAKGMKRYILMFADRLICACATHIVPEGEGVKTDLLNHKITRKPIRVLGHGNVRGVDLDYWKPMEMVTRNDRFTFVFVGRIVRDKGMHELAEAMRTLNGRCRLLLVGPFEEDLAPIEPEDKAFFMNSADVEVMGAQSDVRPFYAQADALVFPSYREGFPNVVLEAGAMGLPCIVTDINGSREIIEHGKNGLIVPPGDAHALCEAMKMFIEQAELVKKTAQNARSMIASRFEQNYVRRCLKDFYKEIMPKKGL